MQMRLPLVAVLALSVALAGCAEDAQTPANTPGADDTAATPPQAVSNDDAKLLVAQAAANLPDRFGMRMAITKSGLSLLTVEGAFDEKAETAFLSFRIDPSFAQAMGGFAGSGSGLDASSFESMQVYFSDEGGALITDNTVILLSAESEEMFGAGGGGGPVEDVLDPAEFLEDLGEEVEIVAVSGTTLRGKPAMKIDAKIVDGEDPTQPASLYVFTDPARFARLEMTLPEDGDAPQFAGAVFAADLFYEGEIAQSPPDALVRGLALRYESDRSPFSFEPTPTQTWTFTAKALVPLGEVQLEGRESPEGDAPAAWTMKLDEGMRTEGGITAQFTDADGDGRVGEGDTLVITTPEDGAPLVWSLRDTTTGHLVVPGAGALVAALAALGAALVLRRR